MAFSRAKQFMAVVSTIRHTEITNEYNEGANCLKNYLRYAKAISQGDMSAAQRILGGVTRWKEQSAVASNRADDYVVHQLATRLQKRGYVVEIGVGQSHFHVELAVRRPEDEGYRLGTQELHRAPA